MDGGNARRGKSRQQRGMGEQFARGAQSQESRKQRGAREKEEDGQQVGPQNAGFGENNSRREAGGDDEERKGTKLAEDGLHDVRTFVGGS